jgi:deoxyribose-phosphate aldolase
MTIPDQKTIEALVDIISKEILQAYSEKEQSALPFADGSYCKFECAEGTCVKTCFNRVGQVVSAGAERISSTLGVLPDDSNLARMIDHTLLKPDATPDKVAQLCVEARKYNFASVCVNPSNIKLCAELLRGSPVKVCSVIGFPFGATLPEIKVLETQAVLQYGATEVDMVINIGALKGGDTELMARDIRGVVVTAHAAGALCKVIIETAMLTDEEKVTACLLAKEAGADFVKTSTGYGGGGATVQDIALMRRVVGSEMGVKASGGIHTREEAEALVKAGANRIGASASVKIVSSGASPAPAPQPAPAAAKGY